MYILPFLIIVLASFYSNKVEDPPVDYILREYNRVIITPESNMYLKGKTTFNSFKCSCSSTQKTIPFSLNYKDQKVCFQNTGLNLSAKDIDCKNKIYNSNLKKSLSSDLYPFISIKLLEAWKMDNSKYLNEYEWFDIESNTNLTIRDISRNYTIKAKAMRITKNKYRIKGIQIVSMKDFKIPLPEIFFGLISFNDNIEFNYDLVFEIIK